MENIVSSVNEVSSAQITRNQVVVYEGNDFRQFLQAELINRCHRNPKYSLRSFAKYLEIDSSALSKILNGKRRIGRITISRLGGKLNVSEEQINRFIRFAKQSGEQDPNVIKEHAKDIYQCLSDWVYQAILELAKTSTSPWEIQWMSEVLGKNKAEITLACERLVRLHLLKKRDGFYSLNGETLDKWSPHSDQAKHLREQSVLRELYQSKHLQSGENSMGSIVFLGNIQKMDLVREQIEKFKENMKQILGEEDPTHLFSLSVYLSPVSNSLDTTCS